MLEISHPSLFALLLFMLRFATPRPLQRPPFFFPFFFCFGCWVGFCCLHFALIFVALLALSELSCSSGSLLLLFLVATYLSPARSFPFVVESNLFLASSSIDPVALSLKIALASVNRKAFSVYKLSLSLSL
jgi:hypothetical protein